jgi:hypothetical protein
VLEGIDSRWESPLRYRPEAATYFTNRSDARALGLLIGCEVRGGVVVALAQILIRLAYPRVRHV